MIPNAMIQDMWQFIPRNVMKNKHSTLMKRFTLLVDLWNVNPEKHNSCKQWAYHECKVSCITIEWQISVQTF